MVARQDSIPCVPVDIEILGNSKRNKCCVHMRQKFDSKFVKNVEVADYTKVAKWSTLM